MPTSRRRILKPQQRRAIVLLAGCGAEGYTEAVMLVHGFTTDQLAGLVRIGTHRQEHRARGQQRANVRSQKVQAHRSGPAGARRSPMTPTQGGKPNGYHHHHRLADLDRRARQPVPVPKPTGPGGSCPHGYISSGSFCAPSQGAQDAVAKRVNGTCPWGWIASGSYCLRSGG